MVFDKKVDTMVKKIIIESINNTIVNYFHINEYCYQQIFIVLNKCYVNINKRGKKGTT